MSLNILASCTSLSSQSNDWAKHLKLCSMRKFPSLLSSVGRKHSSRHSAFTETTYLWTKLALFPPLLSGDVSLYFTPSGHRWKAEKGICETGKCSSDLGHMLLICCCRFIPSKYLASPSVNGIRVWKQAQIHKLGEGSWRWDSGLPFPDDSLSFLSLIPLCPLLSLSPSTSPHPSMVQTEQQSHWLSNFLDPRDAVLF